MSMNNFNFLNILSEFEIPIAFSALIISIIALVAMTKSKKYELTKSQRSEILEWYEKCVEILIFLRLALKTGNDVDMTLHLAKLSALIENGRFYFPNVDKKDSHGEDKPSAYQGWRQRILDFLVYSFIFFESRNASNCITQLETLQREFTSELFDILSPRKHQNVVRRYTMLDFDNKCIDDKGFISRYIHDPEGFCKFMDQHRYTYNDKTDTPPDFNA